MFAYCGNNPVLFSDKAGDLFGFDDAVVLGALCVVACVFAVVVIVSPPVQRSVCEILASTYNSLCGITEYLVNQVEGYITQQRETTATVLDAKADAKTKKTKKTSKKSGKEMSTDKPSWVDPSQIDPKQSAQENAKRLLDEKYGPGNWEKGPRSEYNRITKWINRSLRAFSWVDIESRG